MNFLRRECEIEEQEKTLTMRKQREGMLVDDRIRGPHHQYALMMYNKLS